MKDIGWQRSSDTGNRPTIRRMRGKTLDIRPEHRLDRP